MATDYSSYLRSHVAAGLQELGLVEESCQQFGQNAVGYGAAFAGSVIFFRGRSRIVAIAYSAGDGVMCFVGRDDANLAAYQSWESLWSLSGMTAVLNEDCSDSLDTYLCQFPENRDEMLELVVKKLGEVFAE